MTQADILTSRRILRQAERAFIREQVSTFALRVSCYYLELESAGWVRRNVPSVAHGNAIAFAAMDRRSLNIANRLPK